MTTEEKSEISKMLEKAIIRHVPVHAARPRTLKDWVHLFLLIIGLVGVISSMFVRINATWELASRDMSPVVERMFAKLDRDIIDLNKRSDMSLGHSESEEIHEGAAEKSLSIIEAVQPLRDAIAADKADRAKTKADISEIHKDIRLIQESLLRIERRNP